MSTRNEDRSLIWRLLWGLLRTCVYLGALLVFAGVVWFAARRTPGTKPYADRVQQVVTTSWQSEAMQPVAAVLDPYVADASERLGLNEVLDDGYPDQPEDLDGTVDGTDSAEGTGTEEVEAEKIVEPAIPIDPTMLSTVNTLILKKTNDHMMERTYSGVLVATRASDVGFKRTGRVDNIYFDQGETVSQGEPLAKLDVNSINAEMSVWQAQRKAALAKLGELRAGPRQQTIAAARATLSEYQALREQALLTSGRIERLDVRDAISKQEVDDARLQLQASESRVEAQQQVLKELEAGTRSEKILAQEAAVEQIEASMKSLQVQLDESSLLAPFDAIVAKRMADEGTIVAPGAMIFRLVESSTPEAWIGIPPSVSANLKKGETYHLTLGEEELAATLKSLLPELDPLTRTQTAVFNIQSDGDSKRAPLALGQVVRLKLAEQSDDAGFWLPTSTLLPGVRGLWSVFVIETNEVDGEAQHTVRRRDVEILKIDSTAVLVRGILQAGDRIVARGSHRLTSGQRVRLEEETDAN